MQPTLAGFAWVNAQTAWRLAFLLVYKAGARSETFTCMQDHISELTEHGETLLKEVKLTRPVAKAFHEYSETKGRDVALTLALWEAEAGRLRASGVSEEELLRSGAAGASTEEVEDRTGRVAVEDTPDEPRDRTCGRSETPPSPWSKV